MIFEKFAKLHSPRRLVQFWLIFQISLVVLIINCTPSRVITYTNSTITPEITDSFFQKAKNWINRFTCLRTSSIHKEYRRASVTPYMHSLVYHVPRFMQLYRSVKIFTAQGVEKNNNVGRKVVQLKSNNKNPTSDVLELECRQWKLRDSERMKMSHNKKDAHYWENYKKVLSD